LHDLTFNTKGPSQAGDGERTVYQIYGRDCEKVFRKWAGGRVQERIGPLEKSFENLNAFFIACAKGSPDVRRVTGLVYAAGSVLLPNFVMHPLVRRRSCSVAGGQGPCG
jgi:hypothetical protein